MSSPRQYDVEQQKHTSSSASQIHHTVGNLAIQRSLKQRVRIRPDAKLLDGHGALEQEAERVAATLQQGDASSRVDVLQRNPSGGSAYGGFVGRYVSDVGNYGQGKPLPLSIRASMEERFGADFGDVRVHTDARTRHLAETLDANAFTQGSDIYFNAGRYDPNSQEGTRLLAHELAHVVQQGGDSSEQVQFDLMETLPTSLGYFEIEMATHSAPVAAPNNPGMEGHIRFFPDPRGPYSAQIGLIQVANVTDIAGATTPASGAPVDWTGTPESGRQDLMTTGINGAPPGWFVDTRTDLLPRSSSHGPNYLEPYGESPGDNEYGWLRSPADIKDASLYDYPQWDNDSDFEFETAAKATDTQAIYGSLHWGFGIRSGIVLNEHARAFDAESTTFNEALERFRGYYTHEPIVIYFDTNSDVPIAGEEAKISGVLDYLNRYPDVQIQLDGYADERGNAAYNADLSLRRAFNVQNLAVTLGVDPSRFDTPIGMGASTSFAKGHEVGTWRANRRVVMSFVRTATTPIVMP